MFACDGQRLMPTMLLAVWNEFVMACGKLPCCPNFAHLVMHQHTCGAHLSRSICMQQAALTAPHAWRV